MHERMGFRVHDKPEVFALLPRIEDLLPSQGFLKCGRGSPHFTVDDLRDGSGGAGNLRRPTYIIFLGFYGLDCFTNSMFLEIVHDPRYLGNLVRVNGVVIVQRVDQV